MKTIKAKICDKFLSTYIELVREVMLPYQWDALNDNVEGAEKSHSIENIRAAAGLSQAEFGGMVFQDSDVAKWIEAAAYSLEDKPDEQLEAKVDEVIGLIAKAQQPDGYFNTFFQLKKDEKRFSNLFEAHELYCLGHFIEAAVAYFEATGKREILDIFCKYADLADATFGAGEGKLRGYPGHQEIELALTRLYEATGQERYLKLATYFIDERGREPHFFTEEWERRGGMSVWSRRSEPVPNDYKYNQAHKPVREQTEAVGHAVRAVYMYAAMAQLGRLNNDKSLLDACRALFDDICRQLYVTGAVGSTNHGEAFTFAYDLPNEVNYSETCASIALMFFMHAMLKAQPESEYADVSERAFYNTVLASLSADGKSYFYVNPMEVWPEASEKNPARAHVTARRQKWHKCACCPPNTARLLASAGRYLYTAGKDTVYFHMYASSQFTAPLEMGEVKIAVTTGYPLDGDVRIDIQSAPQQEASLAFRIPGWHSGDVKIMLSGEPAAYKMCNGYAVIKAVFKPGDSVAFTFDMRTKVMRCSTEVRANAGKVCLQRGPIVYALEECDNGENLSALLIDTRNMRGDGTLVSVTEGRTTIGGVSCIVLKAEGFRETDASCDDETARAAEIYSTARKKREPETLRFVPYHLWGNRAPGEMLVWLREA